MAWIDLRLLNAKADVCRLHDGRRHPIERDGRTAGSTVWQTGESAVHLCKFDTKAYVHHRLAALHQLRVQSASMKPGKLVSVFKRTGIRENVGAVKITA